MEFEWLVKAKHEANKLLLKRRLVEGGKDASFVDVLTTDPETGETISVESHRVEDKEGRSGYSNVVNRDVPPATVARLTKLGRVVK